MRDCLVRTDTASEAMHSLLAQLHFRYGSPINQAPPTLPYLADDYATGSTCLRGWLNACVIGNHNRTAVGNMERGFSF